MTEHLKKRVVGFSSMVWQERANWRMEGVLRYLEATQEFMLRDFRFLTCAEIDETSPPPPWKGKTDGIIISLGVNEDKRNDMYNWLRRGEAPVVSLVREWTHPKVPVVCHDEKAAMQLAADYFIQRGFQHFACITDKLLSKSMTLRNNAFRKLLAQSGRKLLRCDLVERPRGAIEDLEQAAADTEMTQFLRQAPKPLAVIAITDLHARAVCWICQKIGLNVPGDVAILGIGNLSVSRSHSPTISSVQTDDARLGYEAMKLLHRLMNGGKLPARTKLIPPLKIIQRESTCPDHTGFSDADRALAFIRTHACEGITVNEVVNNLSIARRTLGKYFQEHVGHSPGQEIQNIRLARAKDLLSGTDLSIIRISQMTGFREPSRFNHFFRKHAGLTPSEYQKQKQR
jgi:LacI family transcriptional regulator